jgi:HTH-type transcriptional regulator, sugar sensing transcriptional regulator
MVGAALVPLGFTEMEAALYGALLKGGPTSGYRLAAEIGKAPPNVYQALETLARKGAVIVDHGKTRLFRAIPVAELIAELETRFNDRRNAALAALTPLEEPSRDHRLYALRSVSQVYAKARAMIGGARETLLFDLFPMPLALLTPDLEAAAARGVKVSGVSYGMAGPRGALTAAHAPGVWERWPGQQVSVVADACQSLIALIAHDEAALVHGLWTDSPYLACLQHSGLAAEIHVVSQKRPPGEPIASIGLLSANPPGLRELTGKGKAG